MRQFFALALLCLATTINTTAQQLANTGPWKTDGNYLVADSVLIPSTDGAMISALVVRKKEVTQPLPVIFQFTIYARVTDIRRLKEAADKGYVGVMAYSRGKRYSEGTPMPYEYDGRDAYASIDWISQQSWCNGSIGMYGGSYNGYTQWAATKKLHPALKTIVPSASVAPGLDAPMMNNVVMSFPFSWTYYVSNNKFLDEADYRGPQWDSVQQKWFELGSSYPSLDSLLGRGRNNIFRTWLAHPQYDAYWQSMIPYKEEFSKINIPILTTTGYYDGGQVGAMYYFRQLQHYNPAANHYLLIGPYGHFGCQGFPDSVYNGYKIDAVANIPIHDIIYEWFNYILKGGSKPAFLKDKINYQPMGSNAWKHAPTLASTSNHQLRLYLDNKNGPLLSNKKPAKKRFSLFEIDFADRNSRNSYYYVNNLLYDTLFPKGGLLYTSAPLERETELTGNFTGTLQVTINKKDMDYSVALFELQPDGKYFFLSYFMGRASYGPDNITRTLLVPGKKTALHFSNSYFTSRRLSKGSRIVIIVNVNKSPFEQINYGSGKDINEETIADAVEPLKVKWHNDGFIELPVWKEN